MSTTKSLTIVLPVHNGESQLAKQVNQILEVASALTPHFSVLVVDDGSTDDTANVARELSARFPQVAVRRQSARSGLGPIISMVRGRVESDVVVVHDGVTPIDTSELRRLWQRSVNDPHGFAASTGDISELRDVRATHDAMARAHGRVLGFHLLDGVDTSAAAPQPAPPDTTGRPTAPPPGDRTGVGQIPPLPRPNFLSAVAHFALGE